MRRRPHTVAAVELIAHRGWWKSPVEKNTAAAFEAALQAGFGIETDIRDCGGTLVISHDMPRGTEQSFDDFLTQYRRIGNPCTLALNIKADGMAAAVLDLLHRHRVRNYFCFDMSVPDSRGYQKLGMPVFARRSELEPACATTLDAPGVWLDAFDSQWFGAGEIEEILVGGQDVCVVSPELHRRDHRALWSEIQRWLAWSNIAEDCDNRLMICTDLPDQFSLPYRLGAQACA